MKRIGTLYAIDCDFERDWCEWEDEIRRDFEFRRTTGNSAVLSWQPVTDNTLGTKGLLLH